MQKKKTKQNTNLNKLPLSILLAYFKYTVSLNYLIINDI